MVGEGGLESPEHKETGCNRRYKARASVSCYRGFGMGSGAAEKTSSIIE